MVKKLLFQEKSVRPMGGATSSRPAPTKSAQQGEDFTAAAVPVFVWFVFSCDDFRSFSFLFIVLFRQRIGDFPEEKD
jgi:hypothetical protein